jgi:hypothetical protein
VPHEGILFAVVAGYVGIVLWCLEFGDSLHGLARLRARRLRRLRSRRYVTGAAAAGVVVACLTAGVVVASKHFGSGGGPTPPTASEPKGAGSTSLQTPRPISPLIVAAHTHVRAPAQTLSRNAKQGTRGQKRPEQQTIRASYVVRTVSAPTTAAPTHNYGPAPLPAPPAPPAPRPLRAP